TLPTAANIINSKISLAAEYGYYGLQLAPDKKIYITANRSSLAVINQPNIKGTGCNLVTNAISVGIYTGLNLPSSINDLAGNTNIVFQIMDSCAGIVQFFGQTTMGGSLQYFWDFGDGNTSNLQNPLHDFSSATQVYKVKLKITSSTACGLVEQSMNLVPGGAIAKAD